MVLYKDIYSLTLFPQVLIPKLKDLDPNPGVLISVLTAIGELAQVSGKTVC